MLCDGGGIAGFQLSRNFFNGPDRRPIGSWFGAWGLGSRQDARVATALCCWRRTQTRSARFVPSLKDHPPGSRRSPPGRPARSPVGGWNLRRTHRPQIPKAPGGGPIRSVCRVWLVTPAWKVHPDGCGREQRNRSGHDALRKGTRREPIRGVRGGGCCVLAALLQNIIQCEIGNWSDQRSRGCRAAGGCSCGRAVVRIVNDGATRSARDGADAG